MTKSKDTNEHFRNTGTDFRGLAGEASDELHKAMLSGLKAINGYFDTPQGAKKNLTMDMKIATATINTYAKLRQAESGEAMVLLQMIKLSGVDAKELLKPYILRSLPQHVMVKS